MIPKTIHLCWFSDEPFPVEIKICLDTWKRLLPDYTVRHWTYEDAKAIGFQYVDEALAAKKWAFAADVLRFYSVYTEGGVYMDSDILIKKRFDEFIPEHGFATFHEVSADKTLLQAAFLIGEKGNIYCESVLDYYKSRHFIMPDGSYDQTTSPMAMVGVMKALTDKYEQKDVEQHLPFGIILYPDRFVMPCKKGKMSSDAFAQHRVYGSWRKRKLGRRFELLVKHIRVSVRYALIKR